MARVVLGIHGLGNKADKVILEEWWRLALVEGLQKQGRAGTPPNFEFKMIYWADIMHPEPLDVAVTDPESPYFDDEQYTRAVPGMERRNHRFRKKLIRFLGKQLNSIFLNEDFTLSYSFIPDYFISRYFLELDIYYKEDCRDEEPEACRKKELIKQRLADTLEAHREDEVLLIAHSMGSIVAYDVLNFFAAETRLHTLVTIGSPLGLPLVVSRIAAQYKTRPRGKKEMVTPPGIYGNWFNMYDILDRITLGYALSRNYRFNEHAIRPRDFSVVNDYHNHEGEHNPHKSYGYLRTKELVRVMEDFLANAGA
ncbi:MAG: hypothetical protein R6U28_01030 [Cyclonatronaceae bacterium]